MPQQTLLTLPPLYFLVESKNVELHWLQRLRDAAVDECRKQRLSVAITKITADQERRQAVIVADEQRRRKLLSFAGGA